MSNSNQLVLKLDYETLVKLLNMDDPEVRVHVIDGILETFARKYVKGVANSEAIKRLQGEIQRSGEQEREKIIQQLGLKSGGGWQTTWTMPQQIKTMIRDQVLTAIQDEVARALNGEEESNGPRSHLEKTVEAEMVKQRGRIEREVARQVKNLVDTEVVAQVQEKVNAILSPGKTKAGS